VELVGLEQKMGWTEDSGDLGRKYLGEAGPHRAGMYIHIIETSFPSPNWRLAASARTATARGAWTSEEQDTPLSLDLGYRSALKSQVRAELRRAGRGSCSRFLTL
jgi:hypothetical protein